MIERVHADIAFLDPPYELTREYENSMAALDHSATPLVIVQHSSRFKLEEAYGSLKSYRSIKQGDNVLSFFQRLVDQDAHQDHDHGHPGKDEQSLL